MGLRHALLRFLPFLSRWMEVTPCCGACPTCGVIGVTGIAANFVGSLKAPKDDSEETEGCVGRGAQSRPAQRSAERLEFPPGDDDRDADRREDDRADQQQADRVEAGPQQQATGQHPEESEDRHARMLGEHGAPSWATVGVSPGRARCGWRTEAAGACASGHSPQVAQAPWEQDCTAAPNVEYPLSGGANQA